MNGEEKTWEGLKEIKKGTILHDEFRDGLRFIIMRGPVSLCAYIGVPDGHPLAGFEYDDVPIDCHGGLTFSGGGDGYRPKGFWWYGWDYAHFGDYCFHDDGIPKKMNEDRKWLLGDVINDSWSVVYLVKQLMKLAEKIKEKEN